MEEILNIIKTKSSSEQKEWLIHNFYDDFNHFLENKADKKTGYNKGLSSDIISDTWYKFLKSPFIIKGITCEQVIGETCTYLEEVLNSVFEDSFSSRSKKDYHADYVKAYDNKLREMIQAECWSEGMISILEIGAFLTGIDTSDACWKKEVAYMIDNNLNNLCTRLVSFFEEFPNVVPLEYRKKVDK